VKNASTTIIKIDSVSLSVHYLAQPKPNSSRFLVQCGLVRAHQSPMLSLLSFQPCGP